MVEVSIAVAFDVPGDQIGGGAGNEKPGAPATAIGGRSGRLEFSDPGNFGGELCNT